MTSTISSPNDIGAKSGKYVSPGRSPPPFPPKKQNLPVMPVDTFANDTIGFTNVNILLFILLVILFKSK